MGAAVNSRHTECLCVLTVRGVNLVVVVGIISPSPSGSLTPAKSPDPLASPTSSQSTSLAPVLIPAPSKSSGFDIMTIAYVVGGVVVLVVFVGGFFFYKSKRCAWDRTAVVQPG